MKAKGSRGDRTEEEKLLASSSLYQEFLKERNEILRHRWLESEKAGKDIGFEKALLDWVRNHRSHWKTSRKHVQPK